MAGFDQLPVFTKDGYAASQRAYEGPSLNDQTTVVAQLAESLAGNATAERAEKEKRYLKSDLRFIGASVPVVRRVARAFVGNRPDLTRGDLNELVEALWNTRTHELRSVGIAVLELRGDLLRKSDARRLMGLIDRSATWAHVDWLAIKVVGALAARVPAVEIDLDHWSRHTNFWVRRSAILACHDRLAAGQGDFENFERRAIPMLQEREFFIRKAIGWVLRSTCKRTPSRTIGFVERHAGEMSALTFKEATRALESSQQRRLQLLRAKR